MGIDGGLSAEGFSGRAVRFARWGWGRIPVVRGVIERPDSPEILSRRPDRGARFVPVMCRFVRAIPVWCAPVSIRHFFASGRLTVVGGEGGGG